MNTSAPALSAFAGWTPFHVVRSAPEFAVLWTWLGDERFQDPFFDQTVSSAFNHPLALLLQRATSLEQLVELAERAPDRPPTAFIFHVSRCGSTLVAQMLARIARLLVLSEARPLTAALEDPRLSASDRRRAFRALIRLYGRAADSAGYIVKLDARNLLTWREIAEEYPGVPRLVLHRDPVEVLVSNLSNQQASLTPGQIDPAQLGPAPRALTGSEDYAAFVLSRFYAAAVEAAASPGSLTLDYRALPLAVETLVVPHFGLRLSETDRAAMLSATAIYSKDASRCAPFAGDSAAKQAEADPATRALAAEWLAPHYEKLRALSAAA
ncbi:MAG TPA: hypothetical protein VK178_18255 [Opitutaceae bacterium]|nr:hypothetical protein [Opitutaceae bacterium]